MLGQVELDDLLSQRDQLNQQLQQILDQRTDPWGIKVSAVEVKHVDLPPDMQRAMARQAEAEREKRAKIIHAAGELEASEKLSQAAGVIAAEPVAITLRYLQTLTEIAAEKNSTIVFPAADRDDAPAVEAASQEWRTKTVSDEGFHEIQLNGKQLVFLFMAVTVVLVVTFLFGVLVGRGVRRGSRCGRGCQQRDRFRSGLAPTPDTAPSPSPAAGSTSPAPARRLRQKSSATPPASPRHAS